MMRTEDKTRMTEGSISRKIILFAIPLFLGNLFQQLYNTADSLIVGNYLGSNALAAVSSSGNLIFLMVGFINGIAMGAGVVIARLLWSERQGKSGEINPHNGCVWNCSRNCIDSDRHAFSTEDPGVDGNTAEVLPESITYFRTYFVRLYRSDHVQYFCRDFAVGLETADIR